MSANNQSIVRHQSSSQNFLFSHPKPGRHYETDTHVPAEVSFLTSDTIRQQFSGVMIGKSFIRYALDRFASSSRFIVLIVQIDGARQKNKDSIDIDTLSQHMLDVASMLESVCTQERGIWGQLAVDRLSCFFPDKNSSDGKTVSESIKAALLTATGSPTVTIGIAGYPDINFSRDQILENADRALDHAEFFGPDSLAVFDAVSLNIRGDKYYQAGKIETAIIEFQNGLKLDPSNLNLHNSLGVCYGVLRQFDKALDAFETAMWLEPDEIMPVHNTGIIYQLMDQPESALPYFEKANGLDANVFEIVFHLGKIFLNLKQPAQGISYLEKAIELKPDSAVAYRYLGECYAQTKRTNEAIYAYKKAVKCHPDDADSLSALGFLYHLQNENADIAVLFCRQSVMLCPDSGLFRQRLGEVYLAQGWTEKALSEFKKATALGMDSTCWMNRIQNELNMKAS